MLVKKWFSALLLLGFMAPTLVHAYDDDDYYYEDEEYETPKKAPPKKAAAPKKAKAADEAPSKMGFAASISEGQNSVNFVYNLGTGLELGLGLGLDRRAHTPPGDGAEAQVRQNWTIILGLSYELGQSLLNYGAGAEISARSRHLDNPTEGNIMDIGIYPNFYITTELVKNVSLGLNVGPMIWMLPEIPEGQSQDGVQAGTVGRSEMNLRTSAVLTFYFM